MSDQNNRRVSICLAEDDDDDAFLINKALNSFSIQSDVIRVKDGAALVEVLKSRHSYSTPTNDPHLVLLDMNLPIKNGLEALKEIKEDPAIQHIPIIILTASTSKEDNRLAYELGANWFIRKPVDPMNFVETVQHVVKYWFEIAKPPLKPKE